MATIEGIPASKQSAADPFRRARDRTYPRANTSVLAFFPPRDDIIIECGYPFSIPLGEHVTAWDTALFRYINDGLGSRWLDPLMLALSSDVVWAGICSVALLLALVRRRWGMLRVLLLAGLSIGVSDAVAFRLLKPAIGRERPCYQLEAVRLVTDSCGSQVSFPSNHAANAMSAAVSTVLSVRRSRMLWILIVPLMVGLSRVYLGVHFPGDVGAGFVLGAVLGAGSYLLWTQADRAVGWFRRSVHLRRGDQA